MGVVPATRPARRPRKPGPTTVVVLAGIGVVLAVGLVALFTAGPHAEPPAPAVLGGVDVPAAPPPVAQVLHSVTYELTGDGRAQDVTYVGQGASIVQVADARTPWSVTLDHRGNAGDSQFFSLSARNAGKGALRCRILVDGAAVSQANTTGIGSVVRCAKSVS